MKKFNEFVALRESAIELSGVDASTAKLSDYKEYIPVAESLIKEFRAEVLAEMVEVDIDSIVANENLTEDDLFEGEDTLNEKVDLKTSTNPLARAFRWAATLRAKAKVTGVYNQAINALANITGNEIKLEIKRDEISKASSGPETKVKLKELDAMIEDIKIKKEKIADKKKQALEKVKNPGFFGAGGVFGLNNDVIDAHIASLNIEEKLVLNQLKLEQAKKFLTDKEMKDLKTSVQQLKAREAKYKAESQKIEQAVENAIEKDDFTDADADIKERADKLRGEIEDIEADEADYREKMKSEDDDAKKEDYGKNLEALEKTKQNREKELKGLAKKAQKAVLGSAETES